MFHIINSHRSKFSSKAVGKIITEAEAKKTLFFFADVIEQISVFSVEAIRLERAGRGGGARVEKINIAK